LFYKDTIKCFSQITRNRRRENLAKASSKKSANSFLAKKSAKLPELSRPSSRPRLVFNTQRTPNYVVFSFRLGKGVFSQDFISFWQCCGSESGSGSTGSTCFWASWILLSSCKKSKKNLDSYFFVTLFDFLSLKKDVNVPSKSNKQKQ
jgi:hypothetical protein